MKGLVDLYLQQFRTTFALFAQYRASIYIWVIWNVIEPLVFLVIWSVTSESRGSDVAGYSVAGFAAYYIVLMVVNHLTFTWIMWEFEWRIRHGELSKALLRPVHPIHMDIVDNLSFKLMTLPLLLPAAGILALLFHPSFTFRWWCLLAFFPAAVLAFFLRFIVEWTFALAAFWTTRVSAVNQGYYVAQLFLSGMIAPLAVLPEPLRIVATLMPFRWMVGFPVELFLGRLTLRESLLGFVAQVVWIGIGYGLMKVFWRSGVRIYSAVGA